MEAVELLVTLGIALVAVFVAAFRRSATRPRDRTISVSDPAIARRAIIDHADAFSKRPLPPFPAGRPVTHSISSLPYGPSWQALRRNLTANILHCSRVGIFAPLEQEAAKALVASLSAREGSDDDDDVILRDILHGAVFALVARLCFGDGMDARDLGTMLQMQDEFFKSYVVFRASDRSWMARLVHWRQRRRHLPGIFHRINEVFVPVIVARRRGSQHGKTCGGFRPYLDSLLELHVPAEDDEHARRLLTDEEIAFLVWEFLGTGVSGTVPCLEWTLAHLATEPEIQDKLHREVAGDQCKGMASELRLPYLHAVVLESLRLHPPLPFVVREVHEEGIALALGEGVVPPGGAPVSFVLGAIGRDAKVWTNPDEFKPERFLDGGEGEGMSLVPGPKEIKMMPFGAGRRHCSGVVMAMTHIKCFLAELVRELEWAPPVDGGGIDFTELDGFFKSMKTPLRVRITPRLPK